MKRTKTIQSMVRFITLSTPYKNISILDTGFRRYDVNWNKLATDSVRLSSAPRFEAVVKAKIAGMQFLARSAQGLRVRVKKGRIIAVIEPRSNTMKLGTHRDALAQACKDADEVCWYQPTNLGWDLQPVVALSPVPAQTFVTVGDIIEHVKKTAKSGDHVVMMSNGGFDGIHQKMIQAL